MHKKAKIKKRKDILSLLDFVFVLGQNQGKESYAYAFHENGGMMMVSDSTAPADGELSLAYQASRIASGTMDACFQITSNHNSLMGEEYLHDFSDYFRLELHKNLLENYASVPPVSYGSIFMQCEKKEFHISLMIQGDVHLFLLTHEGMMLLSPETASSDEYRRFMTCPTRSLLLCVSDACFKRFDGPMDFEYVVLDTLCDSQTIEGWKSLLTKKIASEGTESFLLTAAAFGFGTFKSMHKSFSNRKSNLYWNFLSKETTATPMEAQAMVDKYRKRYLSYQADTVPESTEPAISEGGDRIEE